MRENFKSENYPWHMNTTCIEEGEKKLSISMYMMQGTLHFLKTLLNFSPHKKFIIITLLIIDIMQVQ